MSELVNVFFEPAYRQARFSGFFGDAQDVWFS